jgi:prevent-host-death family protein
MSNLSDIKPITYLKANAAELLKYINETHRPIIITQNGEAKAVLQDPESYESMRKALSLLKLVSMSEEEVRQGKIIDNESVFNSIEKKLKNHEKKV